MKRSVENFDFSESYGHFYRLKLKEQLYIHSDYHGVIHLSKEKNNNPISSFPPLFIRRCEGDSLGAVIFNPSTPFPNRKVESMDIGVNKRDISSLELIF